jgi:hypothetical protein
MANQAQFVLQVSDFTLAGIDKTNRIIRVRGNAIPIIVPGSISTATVVAGGSGWVVGDLFTLAKAPGAIFKVASVSSGAIVTATVVNPGAGGTATTGDVATAIAPSVGISATLTTVINAGAGGLLTITGFSIASSVVTFNVANSLTGGGGQAVVVQGFTNGLAYLNGLYTTASATASTFTASITAPNVGQTNNVYATATVQPTYVAGGVIVRNGFVNQTGAARPIAGIGPLVVPCRLVLETKNMSTYWYETGIVNTVIGLTARAFQGAATAGEVAAGAMPADVIGFIAEYPFGAF